MAQPDRSPSPRHVPRPLDRAFFERPLLEVTAALVGRRLVRRGPGRALRIGRIVEAEAYGGQDVDPSAHSFGGPTPRCAVMFGPPGRAYVYATQGRCHCANVTVGGDGLGRAVLLRAVEPVEGTALMRRRRLDRLGDGPTRARLAGCDRAHELARGPGRLCLCFDIARELDGADLADGAGGLWLADGDPAAVAWSTRIGLNPASASSGWIWRAFDADSPAVSGPRRRRERPAPDPARVPRPGWATG